MRRAVGVGGRRTTAPKGARDRCFGLSVRGHASQSGPSRARVGSFYRSAHQPRSIHLARVRIARFAPRRPRSRWASFGAVVRRLSTTRAAAPGGLTGGSGRPARMSCTAVAVPSLGARRRLDGRLAAGASVKIAKPGRPGTGLAIGHHRGRKRSPTQPGAHPLWRFAHASAGPAPPAPTGSGTPCTGRARRPLPRPASAPAARDTRGPVRAPFGAAVRRRQSERPSVLPFADRQRRQSRAAVPFSLRCCRSPITPTRPKPPVTQMYHSDTLLSQ